MVKIEAADPEPPVINSVNSDIKQTSTELIAFDENHEIQYQGYCKLQINIISKFLKVNPVNENFLDITATFDWKFIKQQNIIFVFAKHVLQDFALIFNDEEKCQKVFNGIFKKRDNNDSVDKEILEERFLIPIFKSIPKNGYSRLKVLMKKWIRKHDNETEKKEYFQLLKEHQNKNIQKGNVKEEIICKPEVSRKRRLHQMENYMVDNNNMDSSFRENFDNELNGEDELLRVSTQKSKTFSFDGDTKIIDESKFKIVNIQHQGFIRRKLLIFTSDKESHCYEFNFYPTKNIFLHLCNAQKRIKAILVQDENGNDCIEYENKKHVCSPILYETGKYMEIKIVMKADYKIIENYPTESKRRLIVFDSNNRSLCYEYFWESNKKKFFCCACVIKNRKYTSAEINHENSEKECIQLLNDKHICKKRKYNPKKYCESRKFVLPPNFEIQIQTKNGEKKQYLIIFDGNDRRLCYYYYFQTSSNVFYCLGCRKKQEHVFAKVCQNTEGTDYLLLSHVEHVCSPQKYISKNEITIRPPKFKFIEATEIHPSKLFIFNLKNPDVCYTFTQAKETLNRFYCSGCSRKNIINAYLYKDENNEYYVKMMDGQKHRCKPKKYESEKYETKTLKSKEDYILFQRNDTKLGLAVYDPNDKFFCYEYYYSITNKQFRCCKCQKKKTHTSAKICQDSNGIEYIVSNQKKHACTPIKISTIINSNTVILENSGLSFEKESKAEEFDESRIVRLPNFELQPNKFGVPERKLIVFNGKDRKTCYVYRYQKSVSVHYICNQCFVSAVLKTDGNNGEKFVYLGENEHKCKPVKYDGSEIKIIEASDFLIFNKDDESKPTKLIIFASSTKELCYEYTFNKHEKSFQCCACLKKEKKKITAKLLQNSNGEESIQLSKTDHLCEPKKFILEEFQPKIVPENGFKICSNRNGKENSKLILFDSQKNDFGYEYRLTKNKLFICINCGKKKTNVTAKLCEKENGEQYLELSSTEHICKSTKCDPKMLLEKECIYENFVVQHNKAGKPKSKITIFNGEDKNHGYQYNLNLYPNDFYCCGCMSIMQKFVSAKLLMNENGNEYVEFGKTEHFCSIHNLKEKNLIFDEFNLKEKQKVLITNTPKNKFYKFEYDSSLDAFCCIKCKEKKKKIVTATICKRDDGKDFVLLNDFHGCVPLKK